MKLVHLYSTIKMMHGPINLRLLSEVMTYSVLCIEVLLVKVKKGFNFGPYHNKYFVTLFRRSNKFPHNTADTFQLLG